MTRKRKYKVGGWVDRNSNAINSTAQGFSFSPLAPIGMISGYLQGRSLDKADREFDKMQSGKETADEEIRMRQKQAEESGFLQRYNAMYNRPTSTNISGFYALGGQAPMMEDPSMGEELSSSGVGFDGPTHEEGGIPMDFDNDGQYESEVEGTEVQSEDRIYSDRLPISEEIYNLVTNYGFPCDYNSSYSDVARKLEKKKGFFEEKKESNISVAANTGHIMITRIDELLEILFLDQEISKSALNLS
jgi:hypothetical protein